MTVRNHEGTFDMLFFLRDRLFWKIMKKLSRSLKLDATISTYFRSVCEIVLVTTWHNFLLYVFTVQLKNKKLTVLTGQEKSWQLGFFWNSCMARDQFRCRINLVQTCELTFMCNLNTASVYGLQFNNKPLSPCIYIFFLLFILSEFLHFDLISNGERDHMSSIGHIRIDFIN